MPSWNRRRFLQTAALATTAGLTTRLSTAAPAVTGASPSDTVRVGIIGLSTKGSDHLKQLLKIPGARVTALCDVDPRTLATVETSLPADQPRPFATTDARAVLERGDVDAVVIATPNHWHALLTLWALQAGKHVYVEKPMSRTVQEGVAMVKAAKTYGKVVQVGTQRRSDAGLNAVGEFIRARQLGRVTHVHTVFYALRPAVKAALPWYPDWLNYDRFCGPSPAVPLQRENLHYDWHWMWDTGNGELGNNGVHVLDLAFALLKENRAPRRVMAMGGRYGVNDGMETPNSMFVVYDYPGCPIFFENRGLPAKPGVNYSDNHLGIRAGTIVHCEGGYVTALTGATAYDFQGKRVRQFESDGGVAHMDNFLQAIRKNAPSAVNAPPEVGHLSASVCHYGNISYRLGTRNAPGAPGDRLATFQVAAPLLENFQRHLRANDVDLAREPLVQGPWLFLNEQNDDIVHLDPGDGQLHLQARYLLRETHRVPYHLKSLA